MSALFLLLILSACTKDKDDESCPPNTPDDSLTYNPTPVDLNMKLPGYLPKMTFPADNVPTKEGIAFGRVLFYEPLLSADGTQSCGSCHNQKFSFTDNELRFSEGIDGKEGDRNSMQIVNPGLLKKFFWDGRSPSLEIQAFEPVTNPIEMHENWPNAVSKLNAITDYKVMNFKAFGTYEIDSFSVVKAIAQFERSLISNNTKFDRFMKDPKMFPLTSLEKLGFELFMRDRIEGGGGNVIIAGADCFHCHVDILDMMDNQFHNNGLDAFPQDSGLAKVTKQGFDIGKFKTPSLRNNKYTAPYMHDGRFETIEEVIDFYSEGLQYSDNIDPLMKNVDIGGVRLDSLQKVALKAFLNTLNDEDFINNIEYSDPNLVGARRQL